MQLECREPRILNAFVAEVMTFAKSQSKETLAKMLGFFHLAEAASVAEVDFKVGPAGDVTLSIRMEKSREH